MKGYKAFFKRDGKLYCFGSRVDFQNGVVVTYGKFYEVGKTFEEDGVPELCEHGMHFCKRLLDCFWYRSNPEVICEVETPKRALIDRSDKQHSHQKFCTNKLTIVRELSIDEIETIVEKETKRNIKSCISFECISAWAWITSKRSVMEYSAHDADLVYEVHNAMEEEQ